MRQLMSFFAAGLLLIECSGCYVWYPYYVGPPGRNCVSCDVGCRRGRRSARVDGGMGCGGYSDYGMYDQGMYDPGMMGYSGMGAPSCGCGGSAPMNPGTIIPPGNQMLPPSGIPMTPGTSNYSPGSPLPGSPNPIVMPN